MRLKCFSLCVCRSMMLASRSTIMCSVFTLVNTWCRCDVNPIMGSGVNGPKPPTSKCLTVSLFLFPII